MQPFKFLVPFHRTFDRSGAPAASEVPSEAGSLSPSAMNRSMTVRQELCQNRAYIS
jgi:hypothetical protein